MSHYEISFTNVTKNKDNFYYKNKTTTLLDRTEFITNINGQKYNETLNLLYPKLENYLQYYDYFSTENFKELYNISKNISNQNNNNLGSLMEKKPVFEFNENIFNFSHYSGIEVLIKLQDNIGYKNEAMEASSYILIDDEKNILETVRQKSDIDKAISKLISLSRAGNNLATALYTNIKDKLNNITEIIRIYIPSMNNLILFKELTEIFGPIFPLNNLEIIPIGIVEESNNLIKNLEKLYSDIDNDSLKNIFGILNDYIDQYIKKSHGLINNISNNLKVLGNLIKSSNSKIFYIYIYYLSHTSTSFVNSIIEAKNILMNYFINQKDLIIPIVDNLLNKFENTTIESMQKQITLVNLLNSRLESGNLSIKDLDEEDDNFKKVCMNLQNSNNYITNIIAYLRKKLKKK